VVRKSSEGSHNGFCSARQKTKCLPFTRASSPSSNEGSSRSRAALVSGSVRASIRCLTRNNSGTSQSRSSTTPRRVGDSEISRAVTELHSRRVQSERAASGDQNRTAGSASRRPSSIVRYEIVGQFNIDLAKPRQSSQLSACGEFLHKLLVFRARATRSKRPRHRFQGLAIPIKNLGVNERPVRRRPISLFDKTKRPPIQRGECFPPRGNIR
jgi:hypothetical protein